MIDSISEYLRHSNSNTNGAYSTSRRTNAVIDGARAAMSDFLNCDPDEVVFGANMTTLTFAISRSIGRELGPGDEILLTTSFDVGIAAGEWAALAQGLDGVEFFLCSSQVSRFQSLPERFLIGAALLKVGLLFLVDGTCGYGCG